MLLYCSILGFKKTFTDTDWKLEPIFKIWNEQLNQLKYINIYIYNRTRQIQFKLFLAQEDI